MKPLSKEQIEKLQLERMRQMSAFKKRMAMQSASHRDLQSLSSGIAIKRNMSRLQCRSYPLGAHIIIDDKHQGEVTPFTFDGLAAGEHEVEMQFVEADGKVLTKKEKVTLQEGKRVVCKLYFKEPKTLADVPK